MKFFFNKFKTPISGLVSAHFPNPGEKMFFQKFDSCHLQLYMFLMPWQNLQKTNDPILAKLLNRQTD